ncbi:MAG: hypothetical protein OXU42_07530 [Deltaproteobacteria bacterium]|nr:hypothetical protein [Deltaproteobacteria bacterium]
MPVPREKFSSQASPELLAAVREIARQDGRHFQAVLEDALRTYVENRALDKPRAAVMAHFQASMERNRRLGELLAK